MSVQCASPGRGGELVGMCELCRVEEGLSSASIWRYFYIWMLLDARDEFPCCGSGIYCLPAAVLYMF